MAWTSVTLIKISSCALRGRKKKIEGVFVEKEKNVERCLSVH